MEQVGVILLVVGLLGLAICFIALAIIERLISKCDKHLEEIDRVFRELERGTPMEEILKMPMPKKFRKELLEIYEKERRGGDS